MTSKLKILPSLLSAPFDRLGEAARVVESQGCDLLHVDVMDGHFVPNLTMGPVVIDSLRDACHSDFDVHLMVTNPAEVTPWFERERVRSITVHYETDPHLHVLLRRIRDNGRLAGVSFNPATPLDGLAWLVDVVDLVLVMTVNPGFGGQKYIEPMTQKIRDLALFRAERGLDFIIQVDGGITPQTLPSPAAAGAEELVAGTAVFGASDPGQAYRELERVLRENARDVDRA